MQRLSLIACLLVGALGGALIVVACSDDSPGDADASTCDCPASEPPLAGRIVHLHSPAGEIPANGMGNAAQGCPTNAVLLGGGCHLTNHNINVFLNESGIAAVGDPAYDCQWKSMSNLPETGVADAICLMPAE
ncbi:MAG TPA: hypothetical protein VHE35_13885 [Kofleriaceae bacterium]|nr:hypothetical protein [Kofleriaceae bacterium]